MAISKRIREESVLELFSSPLKCSLISFSQGGDVVHMRVNVRDMKGKVKFYEQSAEIQFQTRSDSHTASVRFPYCQCQIPMHPYHVHYNYMYIYAHSDAKFLRTHTGSRRSTTFVWNISLL